jgi:hypothetical protein
MPAHKNMRNRAGITAALYEEGAAGVSKKLHAGDDRGIPPLREKKAKDGYPALWSVELRSVEHWKAPNNGNYTTAVVSLRTANDSITRVTPLMIMLTPTRMPIAQAELDGHCM